MVIGVVEEPTRQQFRHGKGEWSGVERYLCGAVGDVLEICIIAAAIDIQSS